MTRFTGIKKTVLCILLSCVLINIVPVQVWAQTPEGAQTTTPPAGTPAAKTAAYAGFDSVLKDEKDANVNLRVMNPISYYGQPITYSYERVNLGAGEVGGQRSITSKEYSALQQELPGKLKNPDNGNSFYELGKMYSVRTSDGSASYYYKREPDKKDVIVAHVTNGKLYPAPNGQVVKASGIENKNNTDINTEQGLINAIDVLNNRQPNTTYQRLADGDQLDRLRQEQQSGISESQKLQNAIDRGVDANGKVLSQAEIENLKTQKAQLDAANAERQKRITNGNNATASNKISTASCPQGVLEIGQLLNPDCILTMLAIVANAVLKMSSFVLYITGNLFDYSMEIAVNSAQFINELGIVTPTWAVIRDMLNMTFIFLLLFIATQILLGKGNYSAKGSIARLVLVAIFMNFSLFAAKIMVDGSNVLSLTIYESIKYKEATGPADTRGSISARIMTTLGLSAVYNFGDAFDNKVVLGCSNAPGTILTVGIFGSILIIITALTFLLAGLLFLLRMLNIIVLFISSPIWIWGYVMENEAFRKTSNWWWGNMMTVLKFPVVFMLMLYVALAMFAQLNSAQIGSGGQRISIISIICNTTSQTNSGVSSIFQQLPLVINFVIVIAALMMIVSYSVKNAGKGGMPGTSKLATNLSTRFSNYQKKITTGAAQAAYTKSRDATITVAKDVQKAAKDTAKAGLTIVKDVTRTAANKQVSKIGDKLANAAAGSNSWLGRFAANKPRVQEALAAKSQSLKKKKYFGETEEEAKKRRQKPIEARSEMLRKVQAEQLKIVAEDEWLKKNKGKTKEDYKKYVDQQIYRIEEIQLGPSLKHAKGKYKNKQGDTEEMVNEDKLRSDIWEEVTNEDGTKSQKLNQSKLYANLKDIVSFSDKEGTLVQADMDRRFGLDLLMRENSETRVKTLKAAVDKAAAEAKKSKDSSEKKKKIEEIEKLLNKRLPEDLTKIDPSKKDEYHKIIRDYLKEEERIKNASASELSFNPGDKTDIESRRDAQLKKLRETTEKDIKKEREKLTKERDKKNKEINSQEEKDKKAKEKADKEKKDKEDKGKDDKKDDKK